MQRIVEDLLLVSKYFRFRVPRFISCEDDYVLSSVLDELIQRFGPASYVGSAGELEFLLLTSILSPMSAVNDVSVGGCMNYYRL